MGRRDAAPQPLFRPRSVHAGCTAKKSWVAIGKGPDKTGAISCGFAGIYGPGRNALVNLKEG